jgi:hypothetical protein
MSNYAAPQQRVENVPYHSLDEMHRFGRRWRDELRGRWFTVPKLSGFCLLMKRDVYEKIVGLDERFGLGFFDDDDLAERARRARFELAVAHDLFVHHFGSRTFAGNGIDTETLLDENAERFAARWGKTKPNGPRVALEPWSSWPEFFADSQRAFARRVDDGTSAPRARPRWLSPRPEAGHTSALEGSAGIARGACDRCRCGSGRDQTQSRKNRKKWEIIGVLADQRWDRRD